MAQLLGQELLPADSGQEEPGQLLETQVPCQLSPLCTLPQLHTQPDAGAVCLREHQFHDDANRAQTQPGSPLAASDGSIQSYTTSKRCSSSSSSSCHGSVAASGPSVVVTVLPLEQPPTADEAGGSTTTGSSTIYDLYTPRRVWSIMLVVALAALATPMSNLMFLPAMKVIQTDLHTTPVAVTSSVATFQMAIGLGALLWGPVSDKWGRKPVLLGATVLFGLTNIPLMLAPNIAVLIIFRTVQGAAIAAYASAGPGMIADICSPASRGTLFGVCSIAALLGPVIGPLLGGGLSQAFGWRSMFVLLASTALILLPLLTCFVPETLQHKVMRRLCKQHPDQAKKIEGAQAIISQGSPAFQPPWATLRALFGRQLVLHVLGILLSYSLYMCSLASMPFYLSQAPYSLSTGAIGAAYLPGAVAAIVASPLGGKLADVAARVQPQQPLRRMVFTNLLLLLFMPGSLLVWGWGLQAGLHLAVPLAASFLASFLYCLYMPGLFTVVTIVRQDASAAAVGSVYAMLFLLSGCLMLVGPPIITALGLGSLISILCVPYICCTLAAFIQIIRACSSPSGLPQPLISRQGSAAFARLAVAIVGASFKGSQAQDGAAQAAAAAADGTSTPPCGSPGSPDTCRQGRGSSRVVKGGAAGGACLCTHAECG